VTAPTAGAKTGATNRERPEAGEGIENAAARVLRQLRGLGDMAGGRRRRAVDGSGVKQGWIDRTEQRDVRV